MRIGGNQANPNRDPTDLYPTDPAWTKVLIDRINLVGPVWEPAAGNGDMVRVIEDAGYAVRATDILTGVDFLKVDQPWGGSIVTNPPYKHAVEFVLHALNLARGHVAMLLPIGFLGGIKRYKALWSKNPPSNVIVVCSRMVVLGKTSQFNHVWVVWDRKGSDSKVEWSI